MTRPRLSEHRHKDDDQRQLLEQLQDRLDTGTPAQLSALLGALHPADTAAQLEGMPPEQRLRLWALVPVSAMGDVLSEVSDGVRESLIEDMDAESVARAICGLDIDDIADLLPNLPEQVYAQVLYGVNKDARAGLDAVLCYDEDTAGGLMNVDTVTVRENLSLGVVARYLRLRGTLPEYTDKLFVVDREHRLTGVLLLSTLLTQAPEMRVATVADADPVALNVGARRDEVAASFERYNLISAPVLDDELRLIGRITIDDVVDVIREEGEHEIMARAGLSEEEDIFAPAIHTTASRALWLGVNLLTAILASWVIGRFEETIEKLVALAVLMPIVASMGGNAGTQTMTVVIRGLSAGSITRRNVWQLLRKETVVGWLNGILWAIITVAVTIAWYRDFTLALIIGVAMCINLVTSAGAGVLLPSLFKRLRIDPALASGVALTTVTDVVGFLAVLGLAALFI